MLTAVVRVLSHGDFILGKELSVFESDFEVYCGTWRYAVGLGNGT